MKKVGMIVFSYYPSDPRVRREAEALVETGMHVEVICLRNKHELKYEIINKVIVQRLNIKKQRRGKLRYIWEYLCFIILSFIRISVRHFHAKFDVIHIHNMPDILIISSFIPKALGAKVVLDLHDPMPEVFMTKYSLSRSHPFIRLLLVFEKFSIKIADLVITPNISFRNLFISRSCPREKIRIVMNSPQENIFCIDKNLPAKITFRTLAK